jgi:hypothetical protein
VSEASLETHLSLAVKAVGGRYIKLPANLYKGIPDRLILLPGGRVWFVELKKEGAQTVPRVKVHQDAWKTFLQTKGFNSVKLVGITQVKGFIDEHVKAAI